MIAETDIMMRVHRISAKKSFASVFNNESQMSSASLRKFLKSVRPIVRYRSLISANSDSWRS